MSPNDLDMTDFERNARTVLEESVTRVDGRVRSRLNQARHAAVLEAARPQSFFQRSWAFAPMAGATAAALLVAVALWTGRVDPWTSPPVTHSTLDDLELLADDETFALIQEGEGVYFYEWAAAQSELAAETEG